MAKKKTPPRPVVHNLTATGIATGRPQASHPKLSQVHSLTAANATFPSVTSNNREEPDGLKGAAIHPAALSASGAASVEFAPASFPLQVHDAVSKTTATSPTLTAHPPAPQPKSSSWTGRMSVREQVHIVKTFAPLAMDAVDKLAEAIERKSGNDPAYADALATLKELHRVLGQLIAQAERGKITKDVLRTLEVNKAKLRAILSDNAQIYIVEFGRALLAAQMIEWTCEAFGWAVEVDGGLIGTIYAGLLARPKSGGKKG